MSRQQQSNCDLESFRFHQEDKNMESKHADKDDASDASTLKENGDGEDVVDFAYGDIEIVSQQAKSERKGLEEQLGKLCSIWISQWWQYHAVYFEFCYLSRTTCAFESEWCWLINRGAMAECRECKRTREEVGSGVG